MKKFIPTCIATTLVAGGLLLAPTAASATEMDYDSFGICTPAEAHTETVDHPAVGEPTIIVDNPDYVAPTYTDAWTEQVPASYTPAVGEPTIDVEQDNPDYVEAVAEVPEISHTDYHSEKYIVDVPGQDAVYEDQVTEREYKQWHIFDGWQYKWFPADVDPGWWIATGNVKTESVLVQDAIEEQGHMEHQTTHEQPGGDWTVTGTEKHITQEYVPGSPAQGEPTIWVTIDNPDYVAPVYVPAHEVEHPAVYTPPVGEEQIEVDNEDYVAAWTETIEHEAVVCPIVEEPTVDEPKVDDPEPAVAPAPKIAAATDDVDKLATTGSDVPWLAAVLGGLLIGGGALIARKVKH